jgi:exonuclease III
VKLNNRGIKIAGNNRHLSILTLNVNGLNASIKIHRIANWVKKCKTQPQGCLQEIHLTEKINTGLQSKGGKVFQANGPHKQAGVAILIPEKLD